MKPITGRLAEEWERTALAIVCVVFVSFLLAWIMPRQSGVGTHSGTSLRPRPSALGDGACAFLDPAAQEAPDGSAFAFVYETPPEPKQTPAKTDDGKDGNGGGTQTGDGTKKKADQGDDVHGGTEFHGDPPPPEIPPRTCSIRYLGMYESTNGQRLAALVLRESLTGTTQTRFLREGEACAGVRIHGFDAGALRILAPDGTEATVERGGTHAVTRN